MSPKRMNLRKSSEGGGRGFSIQKYMLQILVRVFMSMRLIQNLQHDFLKMRERGGEGCLDFFLENSSVLVTASVQ